jgi:hypothetical protein
MHVSLFLRSQRNVDGEKLWAGRERTDGTTRSEKENHGGVFRPSEVTLSEVSESQGGQEWKAIMSRFMSVYPAQI